MILLYLILIFINQHAISYSQLLGLYENDQCNTNRRLSKQNQWYCKKLHECPQIGNFKKNQPKICSFTGNVPIICCPPKGTSTDKPSPILQSKPKYYCEKNINKLCNKSNRLMKRGIEEDLESQNVFPAVIGGTASEPRSHPHMALIGYGRKSKIEWGCGGTVISERFVLSAAHCAVGNFGTATWVRLGDLDISTNNDDARPQEIQISQRLTHPGYKEPSIYNDIALFKLKTLIVFDDWVRPACLHTLEAIPENSVIATGWGRVGFIEATSPKLLEVELNLISPVTCSQVYGQNGRLFSQGIDYRSMLCAGVLEGGKDTCTGDSGGPIVLPFTGNCLKTQVGITSFGKECGKENSPAIYTRVSHFIPWIESIVWP